MQLKGATPILILAVAGVAFGLWFLLASLENTPRQSRPVSERGSQGPDEAEPGAVKGSHRPRADLSKHLPGWIAGKGMPAPGPGKRHGKVPQAALEIAGLCMGRSIQSSSLPEVKQRIIELIQSDLSEEEIEALALYFHESTNPALRFQLMVAFRYMPHEAFVEPVASAYATNPLAALECLQWLSASCAGAFVAFDSILATEPNPAMREDLIARAGYLGVDSSERFLTKVFHEGTGRVDRKAAIAGLSKLDSIAAKDLLLGVIDGEREEAIHDVALGPPGQEELHDLRAHAVIGVLQHGDKTDVNKLVERCFANRHQDDTIAHYVLSFLSVIPSAKYVPDVVDVMIRERKIDPLLLGYIEARGESKHHDMIERLLELEDDAATLQRLNNVLGRLH